MIIYNEQTLLPIKGKRCQGSESLVEAQTCTVIQDVVSTSNLVFQRGASLPAGDKVGLTIFAGENPKTGRRTDIFRVYIKDSSLLNLHPGLHYEKKCQFCCPLFDLWSQRPFEFLEFQLVFCI